ncbi:probable histone-lysine N-methyltransferase set-23 isoform X1 [Uranotaenia lowii]|uniref:probable histone-lysine N-methyltransferase set-23 isoform X1 n=1 Tax=Uranotaenia lowii TaxID=190385 RepID=UPI0024794A86|nr:probable histone-lysine N-methyltransferase set-23 isoform X1 [Uranotaenia lowii]
MSSQEEATPSRNIEIKAQVGDKEAFQKKVAIAEGLTGAKAEVIKQHDVFFNSQKGRLKLRYLEGHSSSVQEEADVFGRGCGVVKFFKEKRFLELDDDYEHVDQAVDYLIENELQPDDGTGCYRELRERFNLDYNSNCCCQEDNACLSKKSCDHGENYTPSQGELVLRESLQVVMECSENCLCPATCWNRLVQFGPRKKLKIKTSLIVANQLGLFTEEFIPQGGFICEYAGELITKNEALRRNQLNDSMSQKNYVLCLNEMSLDGATSIQTFYDPERRGNIGRYLNHSCDPNCQTVSVHIGCPLPRVGIFARRNIQPGEELFFDYGGGNFAIEPSIQTNPKPCLCGTSICRGNLPSYCY